MVSFLINFFFFWGENSYQGQILDNVIQQDVEGFKKDVMVYFFLSVAIGILGGIRSLCFSLIARKLETQVRNQLFEAILRQDVAFFDGMQTGDLTSRLWNNVSSMLAPVKSLLVTVVSSTILLIGGLFMILINSWRLSILAFTTVGPIMLILRIYSKWSRNINK